MKRLRGERQVPKRAGTICIGFVWTRGMEIIGTSFEQFYKGFFLHRQLGYSVFCNFSKLCSSSNGIIYSAKFIY